MFGWIKDKAQAKITAMQAAELKAWISPLQSIDSDGVGAIVAMTAHMRHSVNTQKNVNLLVPHLAIHQAPFLAMEINKFIRTLQKSGNETFASGLFPWLFTVRACDNINLLAGTRELWRQLERGFGSVESAADNFNEMLGLNLDIEGATEFPEGFTPDPL